MKIVYFEVGKEAKVMEVENTLESLQELVGGYIETVTLGEIIIVVNEEGRILELPLNRIFGRMYFYGNFFIVSSDGDEFSSLTDEHIEIIESLLNINVIR